MLDSKKKIIILAICFCLMTSIIINSINNKKETKNIVQMDNKNMNSNIQFNNEYMLYYIMKPGTDEIVYATKDENDPNLEFYKKYPDYNPTPLVPKSTNIEDFLYIENSDKY